MRSLSRIFRQAFSSADWTVKGRNLASLPEAASDLTAGETICLGGEAPTLLQLPDRIWGSLPGLPSEIVAKLAGQQPRKLGIVRSAFVAHSDEPHPLATSIALIQDGQVAVASKHAAPYGRLVVDEYWRAQDGSYILQKTATDLFWLLKKEGIRVALVPDVAANALKAYKSANAAGTGLRQSSNHVLMVAPTAFGFNAQAAQDNHFMHAGAGGGPAVPGENVGVTQTVLQEFAGLHHQLSEVAGVNVHLFQHHLDHGTPDAVFPNNWFSTHPRGESLGGLHQSTLVYYPMKCPNRQKERRADIQSVLQARGYERTVDLSEAESSGIHLEGTGAFVLDRINGVAYVALSERADLRLAQQWVQILGYRDLVTFHATDKAGLPVYHTNVMMAIGTDFAVVCLESVADEGERQHLRAKLSEHHQVVDISRKQMDALCGNVLELEDGRGLPILALSTQAYNAFTKDQRTLLRRHVAALHHAPIDTLEHIGGGGVRCALAELF